MKQRPIAAYLMHYLCISVLPLCLVITPSNPLKAQTNLLLTDLSVFSNPGNNWKLAGAVSADPQTATTLKIEKGSGLLINDPAKKTPGTDLFTKDFYSDTDVELDYLLAKNSNSGIYLQGRYELQLRDSWGLLTNGSSANGGIYERYDERRGKGMEGFEGHAPRQNVSRAPGLWQHLKISFQAPRFDKAGLKTQNARMLSVELNGIVIHENVELMGVTRGAMDTDEVASGPLRFQGDHGAVAFRNISIKKFDGLRPVFNDIHYSVYYAAYQTIPDFTKMKPDEEGSLTKLTTAFLKKDHEFLIRYTGTVDIKQSGEYLFLRETNGKGYVKINGQVVSDIFSYVTTPVKLEAGRFPFEIIYTKPANWFATSFGLTVSASDVRAFLISDEASLSREYPDPITVEVKEPIVLRSFMDVPDSKRVVHAANVGSPSQFHYSYDMDNGSLFQVWRGAFLDATPMWYGRGDGSSLPSGSLLQLDLPRQSVIYLASLKDSISADTSSSAFITKGYELGDQEQTTFSYRLRGATIKDALQVTEYGQALKRTISITNNPGQLYLRIAEGQVIKNNSKGWYVVGDNRYYIRLEKESMNPVLREVNGHYELLVPLQNTISYSILF